MADDKESLTLTELEANVGEAARDGQQITASDLDAVYGIPVEVAAVLGKAEMQVSHLLKLGRGAVIELDRKVGRSDRHLCKQSLGSARSSGCRG